MAISAKFQADFESFHTEAQKAEGELENLAKGAGTVEQSLNKMVTASPGLGALAANAGTLSQAQGRAATATELLHTSLQRFDSVLNSVGLSIGPAVRGLGELAQASGQSVGSLGALSTAGLVAGAAFAGWEVGRWISGVLGLDGAIAHLTGSSQALKNEIAGAQIDTITRAMAQGAPATITYAGAVDFLTKKQKEANDAQKAYETGVKAITQAGENLGQVLNTVDGAVVEAVKNYLDAGVSQKDLAAAYGLTAAQVRAVAKAREADIESMKLQQQMDKETFELAQQHQKQWREEIDKTKDERNKAVIEGNAQSMKAEQDLIDFYAKSTLSSTDYQIFKIQEVVREQEAAFKGSIEQRVIFNQRVEELANEQAERLKAKEREVVAAAVQAEIDAINALNAIIPNIGHGPTTPNGDGPPPIPVPPIVVPSVFHNQNTNFTIPARASGGPVSAGQAYMVGERGPERFIPNTSGTIQPAGSGGPQVIQLVVSDRVLAEVVNNYNTKNMRRSRQLPAA